MNITQPLLDQLCRLSRLELSPEQRQSAAAEMEQIVAWMQRLQDVESGAAELAPGFSPLKNVTRPDEVRPSLDRAELLASAPAQKEGAYVVPKAVE